MKMVEKVTILYNRYYSEMASNMHINLSLHLKNIIF